MSLDRDGKRVPSRQHRLLRIAAGRSGVLRLSGREVQWLTSLYAVGCVPDN